jgi:hypothetical protein
MMHLLIRVRHARHNPEISSQLVFAREIIYVTDYAEQYRGRLRADTLDAREIRVTLELATTFRQLAIQALYRLL